jgi:hypothetical protein
MGYEPQNLDAPCFRLRLQSPNERHRINGFGIEIKDKQRRQFPRQFQSLRLLLHEHDFHPGPLRGFHDLHLKEEVIQDRDNFLRHLLADYRMRII